VMVLACAWIVRVQAKLKQTAASLILLTFLVPQNCRQIATI